MADFTLSFDDAPLGELDQFAQLACQSYNLGNEPDWFGHFRGGLFGHTSRISGAKLHYSYLHEWIGLPSVTLVEYHLASFFFHADSALECFVYALNALGNAVDVAAFRDITSARALKAINPADMGGEQPLSGYGTYFPNVQREWRSRRDMLETFAEQHDVSKHRRTIYIGGQSKMDPPPGFFERLGITDPTQRMLMSPQQEIILHHDPKQLGRPVPAHRNEYQLLETLAPEFVAFVNAISRHALADARANISLPIREFRRSES